MVNVHKIKELCKVKGMTQTFLCQKIGKRKTFLTEVLANKDSIDSRECYEIAQILGTTYEYLTDATDDPEPKTKRHGIRIPVLGKVAGGIPIEQILDLDPEDFEDITEDMARNGQYFALTISGDSMSPEIPNGTNVIVRIQPDVEDGQVAIVAVNGDEATCKRVKKMSNGIMLMPFNPSYEPMFYSKAQVESMPIRILGRVVESRKKW